MSDKDERAQRLAAQLRANLHRRKAQARAAGPSRAEVRPEPQPLARHDAAPPAAAGSGDRQEGAGD